MPNEEHVQQLKKGVNVWNSWRRANATKPDLSTVDLTFADLTGANLRHTDLNGALLPFAILEQSDLVGANLRGALLQETDLRCANLSRAVLTGANLTGAQLVETKLNRAILVRANLHNADLSRATLAGADFTDAILSCADLAGASLTGAIFFRTRLINLVLKNADLSKAIFRETYIVDTDLSGAIGLEACKHRAPSVVDHRTLQRSGSLPPIFLRGVGLPDVLIEYLPSLLDQAIQHYSCFISYSTKDQDFARRLHADLQDSGVRCWFAPHDMRIGSKILDEIDAAIRLRDKVLLILSENSIQSDWVEDEVTKAFEEERKRDDIVLFPVRLDDAIMDTGEPWAAKLRGRHIGDFRRWKSHDAYTISFERLLRDLSVVKTNGNP